MPILDYLPYLVSIITFVGLVGKTIYDIRTQPIQARKIHSEADKLDGERDKIYAEIALKYGEELRTLRDNFAKERCELEIRLEKLEVEVTRQADVISNQARIIKTLRMQNASLKKRADNLERQVLELGGTPIPQENNESDNSN